MRILLLLVLALLLPAASAVPAGGSHWTITEGRDGTTTAQTREHVFLSWRSSARSFEMGALLVDGHEVLAGLHVPSALGPPDARGATLRIGEPRALMHVVLHDNAAAALDVACLHPPDPALPPSPCRAAFPEGHRVEVVQSSARHLVVDVQAVGDDGGIIPCVRLVVEGDWNLEGMSLFFVGRLRGHVPAGLAAG